MMMMMMMKVPTNVKVKGGGDDDDDDDDDDESTYKCQSEVGMNTKKQQQNTTDFTSGHSRIDGNSVSFTALKSDFRCFLYCLPLALFVSSFVSIVRLFFSFGCLTISVSDCDCTCGLLLHY